MDEEHREYDVGRFTVIIDDRYGGVEVDQTLYVSNAICNRNRLSMGSLTPYFPVGHHTEACNCTLAFALCFDPGCDGSLMHGSCTTGAQTRRGY